MGEQDPEGMVELPLPVSGVTVYVPVSRGSFRRRGAGKAAGRPV